MPSPAPSPYFRFHAPKAPPTKTTPFPLHVHSRPKGHPADLDEITSEGLDGFPSPRHSIWRISPVRSALWYGFTVAGSRARMLAGFIDGRYRLTMTKSP